ncbi:hypothetical protein FDECE_17014 [Fusarium decemcellulare]|nr:hypothetical protein FDECE_17014 [Fusarium decemcellulare]
MKYSPALFALTFAVAALAAPSDIDSRQFGGKGGEKGGEKGEGAPGNKGGDTTTTTTTCSNQQQQVCCNGGILGGCFVTILGSNCDGGSYCCETGSSAGGLVNINALNCLNLL